MRDLIVNSFKTNIDLSPELLLTISGLKKLDKLLKLSEPELLVWLFDQFKKNRFPGGKNYKVEYYDKRFEPSEVMEELLSSSLLQMLKKIEEKEITIIPSYDPSKHVGEIDYECSNGWIITVFSRVFEWNGIYGYTSPQGIYFDPFFDIKNQKLENYDITLEIEREVYQFKFENRIM